MDTTTMTYSYTWSDAEQSTLKREDTDGNIAFIPTDPNNRDYGEFLASGATAAPYVAPPPPPVPTMTEKLAAAGITLDELKEALK
jgi:hypothetical protein